MTAPAGAWDWRIRPIAPADRTWLSGFIEAHWGADFVVAHGRCYRPQDLEGFVAEAADGTVLGLATIEIAGDACELVTLDSLRENEGIGSALLDAAVGAARQAGCRRFWLITTNDNLRALGFYQKRGLWLVALHRDALERSRELKPAIGLIGHDGIPLRDELELELRL